MMKKSIAAAAVAVVLLLVALSPSRAQDDPKPEFNDAPITEVLDWAHKSIGVGFIYEPEVLRSPGGEGLRRITARHTQPVTRAERTVLMFELLRAMGLVGFEVGGLPGPTYRLFDASQASRHAPILDRIEDTDGMLYAGLTIRLRRASVQEVSARIRPRLSRGVGAVESFETTQSLVVTDFVDRLQAAWEIVQAAELRALRDDDTVVRDFALRNTPAERAAAGLERLREKDEAWKVSVHETSNVLLISGLRADVERVHERLRLMDGNEARPEFAEKTHTHALLFTDPAPIVRTLRDMFAQQISAGSVQIGSFDRTRTIVFRGSQYDFERARETIKVLDVQRE